MTNVQPKTAVIYCRLSSARSASDDDTGLLLQQAICRRYCESKGYKVSEIFSDDVTGDPLERDGIIAMLAYLREAPPHSHVVIVDELYRLARSAMDHLKVTDAIMQAGASLESPVMAGREVELA